MDDEQDLKALELIRASGKKRQLGIQLLYQNYYDRFRSYGVRRGLKSEDADEVSQNAFVNIVRYCENFKGDAPVLKGWLWRILRNCYIDFVTAQPPASPKPVSDENGNDIEENYEDIKESDEDAVECVRNAFLEFYVEQEEAADALYLSTIEGWSSKELAEYLDRTDGATREYLRQCRKKFAPFMEICKEYLEED